MPFYDTAGLVIQEPAIPSHSAQHPKTEGMRITFTPIAGVTASGLFPFGKFVFQAPPLNQFEEQFAYNHNDFMTAFGGERSRPGGAQLETISFETLWLDDGSANHAPSWALLEKAIDPLKAKAALKKILMSGSPFHLLVQHGIGNGWGQTEVDMDVTMRSFTPMEKEGEPDSRYFSIQLREWRASSVTAQRLKGQGAAHGSSKLGPHGKTLSAASLPASATLQSLSKKYYGTATHWQAIAKASGIKGVGPTTKLRAHFAKTPSQKIKIPPRKTSAATTRKAKH